MRAEKIIKNKVGSLFVQNLIARKGWTQQHAAALVLEFVTNCTHLSFAEFMEAAA